MAAAAPAARPVPPVRCICILFSHRCTVAALLLTVSRRSSPSAGIYKSFTVSSQRISKFKESADAANTVQIYLAVVRLRSVQTDLLISFNVPLAFGHGSSSEGRQIMGSAENLAVIEGVLATLKVREWGLFGGA